MAFRRLSRNRNAEFFGTRRIEGSPWFCLIGAIANDGLYGESNPHGDGSPSPHQHLPIGIGPLTVAIKKPGYLFAFANDAWQFYGNNRGSVRLKVRRTEPLPQCQKRDVGNRKGFEDIMRPVILESIQRDRKEDWLIGMLENSDEIVRCAAAERLGKVGGAQALPVLDRVAREDEDGEVREAARQATEHIRKRLPAV